MSRTSHLADIIAENLPCTLQGKTVIPKTPVPAAVACVKVFVLLNLGYVRCDVRIEAGGVLKNE